MKCYHLVKFYYLATFKKNAIYILCHCTYNYNHHSFLIHFLCMYLDIYYCVFIRPMHLVAIHNKPFLNQLTSSV